MRQEGPAVLVAPRDEEERLADRPHAQPVEASARDGPMPSGSAAGVFRLSRRRGSGRREKSLALAGAIQYSPAPSFGDIQSWSPLRPPEAETFGEAESKGE